MIRFRQKGDFTKLTRFLEKQRRPFISEILINLAEKEWPLLHLRHLSTPGKQPHPGITKSPIRMILLPFRFITQTFKMEFQSPSSCNMDMALGREAGYREEITSTLLSSLFLIG